MENWQDATERIGWYCLRPQIESWHKILKSGCTVEDCRLEEAERLKPYVTLMGIIAWRFSGSRISIGRRRKRRVPLFWPSTNGKRSTQPSIAVPLFQQRHRLFVRRCVGLLNLAGSQVAKAMVNRVSQLSGADGLV